MSGRNRWPACDNWTVAASYRLYRILLIVCPHEFRAVYGDEMAQVFRDCCREAWGEGGLLGVFSVLTLWRIALIDLAITAASERLIEGIVIPTPIFIRVAGLAGLVAGSWSVLLFLFMLSPVVALDSDAVAATAPAMWGLFFLALLGFHRYLAQWLDHHNMLGQLGWLNQLARGITGGAAALLLIGGPIALHVATSAWSWPVAFYAVYYIYGMHTGMVGYVVLGIGLLGTGWITLRTRALAYLSALPLLVSALALLNALFDSLHILQSPCCPFSPSAATGSNELQIAFYLLWAVGWIILGYYLWSHPLAFDPQESSLSPLR